MTQGAPVRIGIEVFGTQTDSRLRGIGRYSRDLVATLLARDPANEYVLYGRDGLPTDQIPTAPNAVLRLLRPDPAGRETTMAHAVERLTETNPDELDVLLLLNPLEMTPGYDLPAKPLSGLKMAAVVYDLIPLLFQEDHFPLWPGPEFVRRYSQGLNRLRDYDVLLAISESTRRDMLSLLGLSPDRVETIGTASDGQFFVPDRNDPMPAESRALFAALGITRPFVYSVGSLEYRKNLWGMIEAFAMLPVELRRGHQLVLTYGVSGPDRDRVRQYAEDRGVAAQLVLTDRLADPALRVLYQRCAAFVFPSSYEGFGLPILEAMHCGAPVLAGNNSSQVEVVGDAGLLFDVADAAELATQLVRVLDDPVLSRELRGRAVARARCFRWEETAGKALDALTRPNALRPSAHPRPAPRRASRRRIAFFSPLPPLRSGVSDYSAQLLDELNRRYAVDVYHDAGYVPHIGLRSPDFGCYDYRLFERNAGVLGYHALVYQVGDSPYHAYMHETLVRHPGIVTLHDLGMGSSHFYERIIERATAVIVHSPWCIERVRKRFPAHLGKTSVVAIGATAPDPSPEQPRAIRARLGMASDALVIASFGPLHATKTTIETMAAFVPLAAAIPEALLIFVGGEFDRIEARQGVKDLGLRHRVRFLGHDPDDLADLAATADIGVFLRRPPTSGATATPLMDLLRLGVPTIVPDVDSLSGCPDSAVRKYRADTDGIAGLTRALRELAEDRPRREAMGRAARQYVRQNQTWSDAADSYEEIIERAVAGQHRRLADGISAQSRPRIVTSLEWLQAAS